MCSHPTWKQNTWAPHQPERKDLPSFKPCCSSLDFTASHPGGSPLSPVPGRGTGCRGEAISHLGEQQNHPVPSKQNFNCTQSNKSSPVVQHTGETIAALGGCKTEKTNGDLVGEKSTRGSAGTCPRDRGSGYRAGSALLRLLKSPVRLPLRGEKISTGLPERKAHQCPHHSLWRSDHHTS